MRSRKVEPGAAVMRTLIQSDSTCVPPVTAERSPPDSRMTGARFAGDRRFVDRGDAFDHLAVGRDDVAGLDQHDVAGLQARSPGTSSIVLSVIRSSSLAMVSVLGLPQRLGLRLAAPSATASAKLANSTVNQSHRMIWKVKPRSRAAGDQVAEEEDRGQRGDDLDHEHHRVA